MFTLVDEWGWKIIFISDDSQKYKKCSHGEDFIFKTFYQVCMRVSSYEIHMKRVMVVSQHAITYFCTRRM